MRVLVAHNVPRARNGGMSRIMGEIHDRVALHGFKIDYFCAEDVPDRYRNKWQRFTFPWLVHRRAREGRYDIVNVHEPSGALMALSKGKAKVVVTSHGVEQRGWEIQLQDLRLGRGGPSFRTRLIYPPTSLWQSHLALVRADHVLCLNFEDRRYLREHFGIPGERITRIFPAAAHTYAAAAVNRDYRRFRRILFAGTWLARKGNLDAARAFAILAQRYPNLEFAALNAGVSPETVREAFPPALRNRVLVIETRSDAEATQALADADVFLLPSIFEGTPLTLMEAMYAGLPIVTTKTCGMADVVLHAETGLLVPMRSPEAIVAAIERYAADPTFAAHLGRCGQIAATMRYTWEAAAKPVTRVYKQLLER